MKSFFAAAAAAALMALPAGVDARIPDHIEYKTLTGYFLQDDPATNATGFDYAAHNFGLINRTYPSSHAHHPSHSQTQWQRLAAHLAHLNSASDRHTTHKLLFLGRHGEGTHNVAETYYGTPAWNCYWSLQDGNGTSTWADAHLTPAGTAQAQKAHDYWASLLKTEKITPPEAFYVSPLTRCLQTAATTFGGLGLAGWDERRPEVKELFREGISGHTCDRRSSKSEIHAAFPDVRFEEGFEEVDPLWRALRAETADDQDTRSRKVLDEVFSTERGSWVSVTSHSGEIASLLRVLGHRVFALGTGQVIPVLVEARRVGGKGPAPADEPWTVVQTCAEPPPLPSATAA